MFVHFANSTIISTNISILYFINFIMSGLTLTYCLFFPPLKSPSQRISFFFSLGWFKSATYYHPWLLFTVIPGIPFVFSWVGSLFPGTQVFLLLERNRISCPESHVSLYPLFCWSTSFTSLAGLERGYAGQWYADVNLSIAWLLEGILPAWCSHHLPSLPSWWFPPLCLVLDHSFLSLYKL